MADKISEIVDASAFEQVSKLKSELSSLGDTLQDVFKNALQLNDVLGGGNSLAALRQGAGNATKAVSELEKYTKQLVSTNEKLALSNHDVKKQLDEATISLKASNQASNDAIKLKQSEEGSITSMRLQLKSLQAQYDNLSASQRNAMGKTLLTDIQRVNAELSTLEQETGRYTRNVGNYGSALSKAWGFIRQAAYILPGLGIAGIFNLAGEAVVALTNQILDYNKNLDNAVEKTDEYKESNKGAISSMGELRLSLELAKKGVISKNAFLEEYNKTLGESAGKTDDFNLAEKNTINKSDDYIKMIQLRAKSQYLLKEAVDKSTEAQNKQDDGWLNTLKAQVSYGANQFNQTGNPLLFFQGMLKPEDAKKYYRQQAQDEAKAAEKAWEETAMELAKFKKDHDLTHGDEGKVKKVDVYVKPTIHIKELKEDMVSVGISPETVKALGDAYEKMYAEIEKDIETEYPAGLGDPEAQALNRQLIERANRKQIAAEEDKEAKEQNKKRLEERKKLMQEIVQLTSDVTSAISDISDAVYAREIMQIDKRDKALKVSYDNELRFIEQSGLSNTQKEKKKLQLQAENEAQQKKIDRDRITAQRKQAVIQKALSVTNIIAKTAEAVIGFLANPGGYPGLALSVGAGIAGGAELAKVLATPLPQYAKGRGKGKDEFAIVGEAGREAILRGDGRLEITPNAPTKTFLKADDMVLNNSELMSAIYRTAMVKLADGSKVSTDSIQMALLEKTDEEIIELKGLRQDLRAKNLTANYYGLSGFESYRQSNIR